MSELEELPSWAGRRTEKVPLPKEPATPEAGPTEPAPAQSGAGPDAGPGSPSGEPQPAQAAIQASQAADAVHLEEAQPLTVGGEPRPRGRSGWLQGLLALLVVAALVGGGAGYVMTRDTSETEATGETGSESALADDEVDGEASEPADGATAAEGGEADTATG
jgi:hypothetical protein